MESASACDYVCKLKSQVHNQHQQNHSGLQSAEFSRILLIKPSALGDVVHTLIHVHRRRTFVAFALMAAQAFFYNAIFFTYALVLTDFYGIRSDQVRRGLVASLADESA